MSVGLKLREFLEGFSFWVAFLLHLVVLFRGFSSALASPPASMSSLTPFAPFFSSLSCILDYLFAFDFGLCLFTGIVEILSGAVSNVLVVIYFFDGSKLGIEPHSVKVSPGGDLLLLDSHNTIIYKLSSCCEYYTAIMFPIRVVWYVVPLIRSRCNSRTRIHTSLGFIMLRF